MDREEKNKQQIAIAKMLGNLFDEAKGVTEEEKVRIIVRSFFEALEIMENMASVMLGDVVVRVEELCIYTPHGVKKVKRP